MSDSTYNNPWIYNGVPLESEHLKGYVGFVYLITNIETGKKYVGRKYIFSSRKKKNATRRTKSESDWKTYYGSNDIIKEEVKLHGEDKFKREILHLGKTKGEVNFLEIEEQFKRDVLYTEDYYNDQIQGKYFKKNVMKYKNYS